MEKPTTPAAASALVPSGFGWILNIDVMPLAAACARSLPLLGSCVAGASGCPSTVACCNVFGPNIGRTRDVPWLSTPSPRR